METRVFAVNIFSGIDFICKRDNKCSQELSRFLSKQIWSPSDRQEILQSLCGIFMTGRIPRLAEIFRPILLDIVTRCQQKIEKDDFDFKTHQAFCIALADCLQYPDIQKFTLAYIANKPSFVSIREGGEPKKKKSRKCQSHTVSLCRAAWLFTSHLSEWVETFLPLNDIMPHLDSEHEDVKWFACQTVMERQRMSAEARETFLHKHLTPRQIAGLKIRNSLPKGNSVAGQSSTQRPVCVPELTNQQTHTNHMILETDLCDLVTCVGGVVISKTPNSPLNITLDLLPVPSNEVNLHSIAMAVSSRQPVLLQGVVGSGKTTLVEHLARLTGRVGPPALMKIQLGDQMDSKALLGTYRCTEVPGEFVWQPGVLTQAVTHGYWVLMEDVDFAPMDVVSVLLPLLETRTLAITGHGDTIRAAPGFHLFATQRLVSSLSGWQRQQSSTSLLLDKLFTSVLVEPLSRSELKQVLCTKYPALDTVVDRLLDIYFLLSAGGHQGTQDVAMETDGMEDAGRFTARDGRLISTRDLMTWCRRIASDFDVSSSATGNLVFQEALDCFVACLSKPLKRLPLAEAIGAKLNLTKAKVEYYMEKYKPDVSVSQKTFRVGRVTLPVIETSPLLQTRRRSTFSYTRQSSVLLERVAMCVYNREPVLLVGETGTGKTSSVQYLAKQLGHKLHVINMNQQSDSADLLGGFKPVDVRHIIKPFHEDFEILFCKSFSRKQNAKFINHLQDSFGKRKWETLFGLMEHTTQSAMKKFEADATMCGKWKTISRRLAQLKIQVQQTQNALAFTFMEGSLVKAIRAGDWVLLDEINLAAMETLECLSGLLESTTGSVLLMERGDVEPVVRHPEFRLFACMNPATDVGKKDLSPGIRNRFTELFVDELTDAQDLRILICDYLAGLSLAPAQIDGIVKFYLAIRGEASRKLCDGTGHPPHYSLRTLCRALRFAARNSCGSVPRSLYEGFCLSFLTQLDRASHPIVEHLVCLHVLGKANVKSVIKQALPAPIKGNSLQFEGYWISVGDVEPHTPDDYILTPSVRANLRDLARVVSAGQHPVLLQGETSVGKTSLIRWLAQSSGNVCVRVNNHEHTDLQEYVGCYAADESGKLAFKEGVLVEAMKKGHWIILDELNLAPTDVLEALNRLLDDNRELYIPETQETVRAHSKFMLFATQNPPGQYGGRKMLSRAFRNRFVELHYDEIPSKELETILHQRCSIPLSYARRLVATMLELQTRRRGSGVFAGKMGFMTLRDLFRWAERYKCPEMDSKKFYNWDKHLADQGYMLLAGRVRKPEELTVIQEVIEKHFKCKLNADTLFSLSDVTSLTTKSTLGDVLSQSADGFQHIVWTYSMRRLAVLIGQAIKYKEPVLLVGETGCGKTTMCQLYAALYKTALHSVNCHLHTESADFLGGLRPVRAHSQEDKKDKLFEWVDGPLVQAMRQGAMFLIDEISLADDSVLERLNSVLETDRTILLAEKGGGAESDVESVTAADGFQVFATMNPGGDFGKKELSPALRNRFTEIWCPPSNQRQDLIDIIEHNLHAGILLCNHDNQTSGIGAAIMDFVQWFGNNELGRRCTVSIRDILTWVHFINTCSRRADDNDVAMETEQSPSNQLEPAVAYIHGACLVFLDGLGAGTTSQGQDSSVSQLRSICLSYLLKQVNTLTGHSYSLTDLDLLDKGQVTRNVVKETDIEFCIPPFSVPKGDCVSQFKAQYALQAPGPCVNAQRILRALQLPRPLLLEGSPGVGKTSLVSAIARASGRELVRINLSEQTDVTDLFGADLPVEGAEGGVFAWRDGPLLQALKSGAWVVLDELNLASQAVLEGLNACLDHRAEIYIPELGKTFHIQHEKTRLFGCQNPLNQGGGRKGLPRSFLNRFTQVYVEPLSEGDLMFIAVSMYPSIPEHILALMVKFNMKMHEETVVNRLWGQKGSPWEFNLRDLFRWCDLLQHNQNKEATNPGEYVGLVYADRMRTLADKHKVYELYKEMFPRELELYRCSKAFHYDPSLVQIGHSFLKVKGDGHCHGDWRSNLEILHHSLGPLESVLKCVEMNWMTILVGPPCSGKSSVVEMLSQLTGNQLQVLPMNSAMDTTELLGGFEQADDSRHIEDIATEISQLVEVISSRCLLLSNSEHLATVARLQEQWTDAANITKKGDMASNVEELAIMKRQVVSLLALLADCRRAVKTHKLNKDLLQRISGYKARLKTLESRLSTSVAGQGGGAFEWVDSLLVKALRLGHWLLIDNVNFCSASVLDRLNALLEPHGVLSINERGVIDGEIPTIKPHPDFRLFFSMDPKHGEISRAMRNRGIEIYVHGEEDGHDFSDLDLRLMFHGMGLKSKPVFDWLLHLHNILKEELPRGDKPGIQRHLQACSQLLQHCNHGNDLETSVRSACYSVYVQSQRHTASRQLSLEVLNKEMERFSVEALSSNQEPELGINPVSLPNVTMITSDPVVAMVNRSVAMFTYLLNTRNEENQCEVDEKLKYALMLVLNMSSETSLPLTLDWLQKYCQTVSQTDTPDVCKYVVTSLQDMGCDLLTFKVKDTADGALKEAARNCPLDMQWNRQMMEKVLQTLPGDDQQSLTTTFNRLHCRTKCEIQACLLQKWLKVLQQRLGKDRVQHKQTTHPAISHLVALFPVVTSAVRDVLQTVDMTTYTLAAQVLECLSWVWRLYEVANWSLDQSDPGPLLSLHWTWAYKRALQTCLKEISSQGKMEAITSVLQSILGKDDRKWKWFVTFWRSWGHPRPFVGQAEANCFSEAFRLFTALNLTPNPTDLLNEQRLQVTISRRKFLVQTALMVFKDAGAEESHALSTLREILTNHKLVSQYDQDVAMETDDHVTLANQSEDSKPKTEMPIEFVRLWPVFDYCLSKFGFSILLQELRQGESDHIWETFTDYAVQFTPARPSEVAIYRSMTGDYAKSNLSLLLSALLRSQRQSCAINNPGFWLTWSTCRADTEEGVPKTQFNIHKSVLSHALYSLLAPPGLCVTMETPPCVKISAPLKSYTRELTQLNHVSSHIWAHVDAYWQNTQQSLTLDRETLIATSLKTIETALSNFHTENTTKLTEMLNKLTNTETLKVDDFESFKTQMLEDLNAADLDPEYKSAVVSMLDGVASVLIDRSHDEGGMSHVQSCDLCHLGEAWLSTGMCAMTMFAPCGPVDPVEKVSIKLDICRKELQDVEAELEVVSTHHRLVTGENIVEQSDRLVHPRVSYLKQRAHYLREKAAKLEKQVAYRPVPSQYSQLVTDVNNFLASVTSVDRIARLVTKLKKLLNKPVMKQTTSVFSEVDLWTRSQEKFIDMMEAEYPAYRDVTAPFICALHQTLHGMHILYHELKRVARLKSLFPDKSWNIKETSAKAEDLILALGKFPSLTVEQPSCLHLATTLTSADNLDLVQQIMSRSLEEGQDDQTLLVIDSILSSSLLLLKNEALTRFQLTPDLAVTLTHILEAYVSSWQREEAVRRAKEEEKASLYRFKSQVHGDERSEEEQLEADFRQAFPQFHKDFADLVEPISLEDISLPEADDNFTDSSSATLHVSDAQMTLIYHIHRKLYMLLVPTSWYRPDHEGVTMGTNLCDWIQPLLRSYPAAASLTLKLTDVLGSHVDRELLGGHLVVSAVQQLYILEQTSQQDTKSLIPRHEVYDIFHDPNVPEVIQCLPVIQTMRGRVHELQEDWPDHPTLKRLCEVMDRIEGLPITSPVMKYLTGIELLLQTAQEWESNASQHVSMAMQMADISRIIVQWRKLELDCWSKCLDTEVHKYRCAVSKWWFHIYQLLQSALHPQEGGDSASVADVIKTLKQFVEQSTLGDYHVRLELLQTFHFHLVTIATQCQEQCPEKTLAELEEAGESTSPTQDTNNEPEGHGSVEVTVAMGTEKRLASLETVKVLKNVLWNMYKFYSRFSEAVKSELERLRQPIEKELKGFVKIARWSDINFWALKQTAEKTHRTLHKHIKQFQGVLRLPVQSLLGDVSSSATTDKPGADNSKTTPKSGGQSKKKTKSGASHSQTTSVDPESEHSQWAHKLLLYEKRLIHQSKNQSYSEVEIPEQLKPCTERLALFVKIPQLARRLGKHWRSTVMKAGYCDHIATLDQFTGEVIEDIQELQALDINRNDEKEKQKSEAKHINLKKRKALSDLFRYLTKLGLSYRKGLTLGEGDQDEALKVEPLDLHCLLKQDTGMQAAWEGCTDYYFKCVAKRAQFLLAIANPSKELGVGNIERCKGFTEHLFRLMIQQHRTIATLANHYNHTHTLVTSELKLMAEDVLQQQQEARQAIQTCSDIGVEYLCALNQFLTLLHCCPRQPLSGEITHHPSPIATEALHSMATTRHGDETIRKTIDEVQEMVTSFTPVRNSSGVVFRMDLHSRVKTSYEQMANNVPRIKQLCRLFSEETDSSVSSNAFTEGLLYVCDKLLSEKDKFYAWYDTVEAQMNDEVSMVTPLEVEQFAMDIEHLLSDVLMVVQKQYKQVVTMETGDDDAGQDEDNKEDDEDSLKDGHLVSVILETLHKSTGFLDSRKLLTQMLSLQQTTLNQSSYKPARLMSVTYHQSEAMLQHYMGIVHHHLLAHVAVYRTIGKLLSVLLGLFTDLASKGFCIPPELSEEMSGEGATEFCDMEDAGLGDGEGVKNVSDQIESEDQLEEAKRPEDYEKEDQSNQPDVKSEENAIEMSDDFDAKMQDLEDADKQENDDDDNGDDEADDIDKRVGDVDGEDNEKLDEQMWGSDQEEEGDEQEEKEEDGPGFGREGDPELVAKDDNKGRPEDENEHDKDNSEKNEETEEKMKNYLDQMEEDDDQIDPYHGEQEEKQAPDDLDLPDDLRLDDNEEGGKEGGEDDMDVTEDQEDKTQLPPDEEPEQPDDTAADDKQESQADDTEAKDGDQEDKEKSEDQSEETPADQTDEQRDEQTEEQTDRQEEEGKEDPGFTPQDESVADAEQNEDENQGADDKAQEAIEHYGKVSHDTADNVEQSDTAQDAAGDSTENNQQEVDGTGQASADQQEGHQGQRSTKTAESSNQGKRKQPDRKPGKADSDRSLASADQRYKRLKTTDKTTQDVGDNDQSQEENKTADQYEHVRDSDRHHDAQTLDVATGDQLEEQQERGQAQEESGGEDNQSEADEDTEMAADQDEQELDQADSLTSSKLKKKSRQETGEDGDLEDDDLDLEGEGHHEIPGDKVLTATVSRGAESTIHTCMENLNLDSMTSDLESLRAALETELGSWNQSNLHVDTEKEAVAGELWHRYEALTSSLAQDLCEQLRLVLEPSQATKLKGDYRTGKRLNMRKVIPYIASQFRKDKIWLRRTKPSKRQYQIMLAVDDSSSMVDNHSKQMAFESLCLVSNALTLLEAGELSICSFGEEVNVLHPFTEQFTSQSGAQLLQHLTFEQKKTKIALLLKQATAMMLDARQKQPGGLGCPETSQLLLIVSDGRGLFLEGMEAVQTAVRQAREANVFIVFVVIDNPINKDSILDIKVPVFKSGGQVPEIRSYMDNFPFPFYILLRDINNLPMVLSDALRQWFELVTAVDR